VLRASRIEWLESRLYPKQEDTDSPEASLLLASPSKLVGIPGTWMAAGGVDVLRREARAFDEAFLRAGVKARMKEYVKMPNMLLKLDKLPEFPVISDVVEVVRTCGSRNVIYSLSHSVMTDTNICPLTCWAIIIFGSLKIKRVTIWRQLLGCLMPITR
jgi:acetyl esterase/lipase